MSGVRLEARLGWLEKGIFLFMISVSAGSASPREKVFFGGNGADWDEWSLAVND